MLQLRVIASAELREAALDPRGDKVTADIAWESAEIVDPGSGPICEECVPFCTGDISEGRPDR